MKKILLTAMTICLMAGSAMAQSKGGSVQCSYTPMQTLIRDARNAEQVQALINNGVQMNDSTIKCGGDLLQLAIRRGNIEILGMLLGQSKNRINTNVSLNGFEIPGAPKDIPLIMFAAYYAPSEAAFQELMNAGADVTALDANKNSVAWYIDQNPVLRETATSDQVMSHILYGSVTPQNGKAGDQPAKK